VLLLENNYQPPNVQTGARRDVENEEKVKKDIRQHNYGLKF